MNYNQSAALLPPTLLGATVSLVPSGSADTWNVSLWSGMPWSQGQSGGSVLERRLVERRCLERLGVRRPGLERRRLERRGVERCAMGRRGLGRHGLERLGVERVGLERQRLERLVVGLTTSWG